MVEQVLQGRYILVVEDDYFIAGDMQRELEAAGARVVGPAPSVSQALRLMAKQQINCAVLDINLGDERSFPVAEALQARKTPFVFITGYNRSDVPQAWRHVRCIEKPMSTQALASALAESRPL